ncbi:sodium/bile acid cotransporter [Kryptolebias marmoratus]|uniref:Hepatic sodium/bile acid cotransporter n=1 Tax=Kryptolebias marmoratus TaxID=37003 RepID=A0A3Q2ZD47_KRYMA|nr:sodium/bile acid cotransporter [Kryptolebias marmoratus]XP_017271669.1 sodium/bile acid cotransporter [Kryptolebias marmoratus]XP_017271690.1 sodium/bile acid cotransporter [Kryptolebias marmoratus]XP_037833812.1 sodium/bile acid cotransporter [Kryptolebias marmoratus]XP_037833813.1 sodium/bile acid cotransporter [Kryptolebias marmoratus]XP_037833814.1 sodium/bile acid cotransporter [Kryptolebias marmoratus]XP_037833815.1 sodium/bile acid cotransporter [Kryptolebias marmoratus]XP_03783381
MNETTGHVGLMNLHNLSSISGNGSMSIFDMPKPIDTAINILSISTLFITMISLGCTMEISKIKAHLLKPKGVAIALVAQFCIMPLTAFSLAKILQLHPVKAITVLICGCCPGGSLSNTFSFILKGDMNLSIVMTTCSTVAALGLMPLLLYIFSQGFTGLENAVPYVGIITALISTLVPCAIGILINHYKPNYSAAVTQIGLIIMMLTTIAASVVAGIAVKDVIWMIFMPDVVSVAVLMPLIGFTLGYVMSVICRLSPKCSRTISMETGCQNIQLCIAILKVTFSPQVIGPMFLFPLLYIMFQCAEALLLALCFRLYHKVKTPAGDTGSHKHVAVTQEEVKEP